MCTTVSAFPPGFWYLQSHICRTLLTSCFSAPACILESSEAELLFQVTDIVNYFIFLRPLEQESWICLHLCYSPSMLFSLTLPTYPPNTSALHTGQQCCVFNKNGLKKIINMTSLYNHVARKSTGPLTRNLSEFLIRLITTKYQLGNYYCIQIASQLFSHCCSCSHRHSCHDSSLFIFVTHYCVYFCSCAAFPLAFLIGY